MQVGLMKLKEATHKYKAIVIKNQHNLEPIKHWELVTRLVLQQHQYMATAQVKISRRPADFYPYVSTATHIS
jgi:hypothetical protein